MLRTKIPAGLTKLVKSAGLLKTESIVVPILISIEILNQIGTRGTRLLFLKEGKSDLNLFQKKSIKHIVNVRTKTLNVCVSEG
jgi:hypothetical protein